MSIKTYIKNMIPTINDSGIVNDLGVLSEEYNSEVQPAYLTAINDFAGMEFRSPKIIEIEKRIDSHLGKGVIKGNMVEFIYTKYLSKIPDKIKYISEQLKKRKQSTILSMNLKKIDLTLLRLVELLYFACRYARKFLTHVLNEEINSVSNTTKFDSLTQESVWLRDNLPYFAQVLRILGLEKFMFVKQLTESADLQINIQNVDRVADAARGRFDPMRLFYIPVSLNPLYHIGMAVANYQVSRYNEAQDERKAIIAKINYYKKLNDGKDDAALEKVIIQYERQYREQSRKIEKLNQKYGINNEGGE